MSYLNAKPLIFGLEGDDRISLRLDVPSRLGPCLGDSTCDVSLLPVIDYQRIASLRMLSCGGIASDGETLTVRIFSSAPIECIRTLACDTDSHTSVALAHVVLAEQFRLHPAFVDLTPESAAVADARLLIGDKVVCDSPRGMAHQLDLGAAWKQLTGLPFVFALWTARNGVDLGDLPDRLDAAKRAGLANIGDIVQRHAVAIGWPAEVAYDYLTRHIEYDMTPRHFEAIRLFYSLAHKHGVLKHKPRPIEFY